MDRETGDRCAHSVQQLTVFFEEPFWVGIFEKVTDQGLSACKVTFGAEPKEYEVQAFLLKNYDRLIFSPAVAANAVDRKHSPKRMQRLVRKEMCRTGTGTKSQQALKLQQEQYKTARRKKQHRQRQEALQRRFELKQQKRREKHRGR